jgi:phage terminase large subunit
VKKERLPIVTNPQAIHSSPQIPRVEIPAAFRFLFTPSRYKVAYGGRDGAKSWAFADALLIKAAQRPLRILCTRELQSSIAESVYKVLTDQILRLNLVNFYPDSLIQKNIIRSICGSEFIFKGLRANSMEIKSTEGIDICWVEEAQMVSHDSWQILIPTIRKEGSEIWISFNTGEEEDPTYRRFVLNPPPEAIVRHINYDQNPFHSSVMEKERIYLLKVDPEAYENVWLGTPKKISDACIFKGKFRVDVFETPEDAELLFGSDFGFSEDPATLIRFFIQDRKLFVEYEAYGIGVELDDLPEFYDRIPGARKWAIKADNSRPETISYVKKKASISRPAKNGRGALKTVFRSSRNLKRSLSMSAAATPCRSLKITPGRKTGSRERSCPSSWMSTTIASTRSAMAWGTRSKPNPMRALRSA